MTEPEDPHTSKIRGESLAGSFAVSAMKYFWRLKEKMRLRPGQSMVDYALALSAAAALVFIIYQVFGGALANLLDGIGR